MRPALPGLPGLTVEGPVITLPNKSPMSKVSLRRLLSKLTALALTTSAVAPAAAAEGGPPPSGSTGTRCDDCLDDDLADDVPIDREHVGEVDAGIALGRSLAVVLDDMRPLSATQIVSTWALSEDPVRRLAVAHALEWAFPLVGDSLAIDHLSRDPDPEIRVAAARAAWVRRSKGGDPGVLARLSDDPDPRVRMVARNAR